MNEYDSARMADLLRESDGYELVGTPEEADVLLLNTCSIRVITSYSIHYTKLYDSITGGIIHITNHAFAKITLFFCAGAIFVRNNFV